MNPGDDRHLAVAALVESSDANEIFTNVKIGGRTTAPPYGLTWYMALYVEPDDVLACRFVNITGRLDGRQAARFIVDRLKMSQSDIDRQPIFLLHRKSDVTDMEVEQLVLSIAQTALGGRNLPVAMVACLTSLSGARMYLLYYPQVVPGEILLGVLQRVAPQTFS